MNLYLFLHKMGTIPVLLGENNRSKSVTSGTASSGWVSLPQPASPQLLWLLPVLIQRMLSLDECIPFKCSP